MPNQRAPNKSMIGLWVDDKMKERLRRLAKARGVSLTALCEEHLKNLDKESHALKKKKTK